MTNLTRIASFGILNTCVTLPAIRSVESLQQSKTSNEMAAHRADGNFAAHFSSPDASPQPTLLSILPSLFLGCFHLPSLRKGIRVEVPSFSSLFSFLFQLSGVQTAGSRLRSARLKCSHLPLGATHPGSLCEYFPLTSWCFD